MFRDGEPGSRLSCQEKMTIKCNSIELALGFQNAIVALLLELRFGVRTWIYCFC